MTKHTIISLFRGIDALLLLVSLVALAIFLIFTFKPSLVSKLDDSLQNKYQTYHENKFRTAQTALRSDANHGIQLFLELANDYASVKKTDRLAMIKSLVLRSLSEAYLSMREFDSSLSWAQEWIEFDNNDFEAKAQKVKVLFLTPGKADEGKRYIDNLFKKYPDIKIITKIHTKYSKKHNQI